MIKKIENFSGDSGETSISWEYDKKKVEIVFQKPVFDVCLSKKLNEVIVVADNSEVGYRNLIIYNANGTLRATPEMPKLPEPVRGVYSIWCKEDSAIQILVLLTELYSPYDTKCNFDLDTLIFSETSPTK